MNNRFRHVFSYFLVIYLDPLIMDSQCGNLRNFLTLKFFREMKFHEKFREINLQITEQVIFTKYFSSECVKNYVKSTFKVIDCRVSCFHEIFFKWEYDSFTAGRISVDFLACSSFYLKFVFKHLTLVNVDYAEIAEKRNQIRCYITYPQHIFTCYRRCRPWPSYPRYRNCRSSPSYSR